MRREPCNGVNVLVAAKTRNCLTQKLSTNATIQFSTKGGHTLIQQIDTLGRVVKVLTNQEYVAGAYNIDIYNDGLASGAYFIRLQNKSLQRVINVVKMPL